MQCTTPRKAHSTKQISIDWAGEQDLEKHLIITINHNVCMLLEVKKSPQIVKRWLKPERCSIYKISSGALCPVLDETFGGWPGAPREHEKEHHSTR